MVMVSPFCACVCEIQLAGGGLLQHLWAGGIPAFMQRSSIRVDSLPGGFRAHRQPLNSNKCTPGSHHPFSQKQSWALWGTTNPVHVPSPLVDVCRGGSATRVSDTLDGLVLGAMGFTTQQYSSMWDVLNNVHKL